MPKRQSAAAVKAPQAPEPKSQETWEEEAAPKSTAAPENDLIPTSDDDG